MTIDTTTQVRSVTNVRIRESGTAGFISGFQLATCLGAHGRFKLNRLPRCPTGSGSQTPRRVPVDWGNRRTVKPSNNGAQRRSRRWWPSRYPLIPVLADGKRFDVVRFAGEWIQQGLLVKEEPDLIGTRHVMRNVRHARTGGRGNVGRARYRVGRCCAGRF